MDNIKFNQLMRAANCSNEMITEYLNEFNKHCRKNNLIIEKMLEDFFDFMVVKDNNDFESYQGTCK